MSGGASCVSLESQRSGLNRRPLDYESSALPLSYAGGLANLQCPGTDSNRDALRHHPLKMACLPISPPGRCPNCGPNCGPNYGPNCGPDYGADGGRTRDLSSDSRVL